MSNATDNTHSTASVPRHAATMLLLRETHGQTEVLMVRRHADLAFMGGLWVFPGGALNPADTSDAALDRLVGHDDISCRRMRTAQGEPLSARECLGLAVAACRETFEETGILLARYDDGRPCDEAMAARLHAQRALVVEKPALFIDLLAREQLHPDVGCLVYWAHWITPSSAPRRFDTRFFIVMAPASQAVTADTRETVESAWMRPADLIAAAQRGEMPIAHATLCNLEDLQAALMRHGSLGALLAGEAARIVTPIVPKILREDGRTIIVLPWDASYVDAPGEGVPMDAGYQGALRDLPSRIG